jgi:hypothetical protein
MMAEKFDPATLCMHGRVFRTRMHAGGDRADEPHEIFRAAMYQGYEQIEILPIAMMGRPRRRPNASFDSWVSRQPHNV